MTPQSVNYCCSQRDISVFYNLFVYYLFICSRIKKFLFTFFFFCLSQWHRLKRETPRETPREREGGGEADTWVYEEMKATRSRTSRGSPDL
jgi:hypothetical protein